MTTMVLHGVHRYIDAVEFGINIHSAGCVRHCRAHTLRGPVCLIGAGAGARQCVACGGAATDSENAAGRGRREGAPHGNSGRGTMQHVSPWRRLAGGRSHAWAWVPGPGDPTPAGGWMRVGWVARKGARYIRYVQNPSDLDGMMDGEATLPRGVGCKRGKMSLCRVGGVHSRR